MCNVQLDLGDTVDEGAMRVIELGEAIARGRGRGPVARELLLREADRLRVDVRWNDPVNYPRPRSQP